MNAPDPMPRKAPPPAAGPAHTAPDTGPATLYESAPKIYARSSSGRYSRLRVATMLVLLGVFYGLPWLQWQGHPLVLFDLPARRFHLLGLTLFPQDLFLLAGLLVVAAFTLFLFTTLGGRLWCGYACPQTVWTEAFMWIERLCEGDRHQRQKLDAAPWSLRKLARKGSKHALWIALGLYTGLSFVAYFIPARELFPQALTLSLGGWALFWTLFYGFATWGNGGFMREQVCKYMCPYARFQSAMFDRDTLIIAYDAGRGEPRKGVARKAAAGTRGDCVDCSLCVQVCPVGIDIRQGLQYECIACAACVDACNGVMDKLGKPHGLIHYTSERRDAEGRFRLLRPRTLGYGLVWLLVLGVLLGLLATRSPVSLDVLRDRRQLYRELADGEISNVYKLRVANKADAAREFTISATLDDGTPVTLSTHATIVEADSTGTVIASAMLPPERARGIQTLRFEVRARDDAEVVARHEARFVGVGS